MSFIAILLTIFLEQRKLLEGIRGWFNNKIEQYANLFVKRDFQTVREIRLYFIFALIPFLLEVDYLFAHGELWHFQELHYPVKYLPVLFGGSPQFF